MRSSQLAPLAAAFIFLGSSAAWAVATRIDVSAAGEPVAQQTLTLRNTTTGETLTAETDEHGRASVDLAAGTWVATTPDGEHSTDPFQPGETVRLALPRDYGEPDRAPPPGSWQIALDLGGGYSWMDSDSDADGNHVTEEEVEFRPFPDLIETRRVLTNHPFSVSSGDASEGGYGYGSLQLMGPPCPCWGIRPLVSFGVPFNRIEDSLLDERVGNTGRSVELDVERYFFDLTLGISKELPHGFGIEGGLHYRNDRVKLIAAFDSRETERFHVHSLGPRFNLTKRLLKRGNLELGVFAGGSVLFPVGDEDHSIDLVGARGSVSRFEWEAKTQLSASGGIRLVFNLPGL